MLAVLFSVASGVYALSCSQVIEVLPIMELRAPAQAFAWHAGEFAYRGALVPVVDACQLIGGYTCSRRLSSRVALVHCTAEGLGQVIVGVLAERMTAVRHLDGTRLTSNKPAQLPYLGGIVKEGMELVQALDVEGLLRFTLRALVEPATPPLEMPA